MRILKPLIIIFLVIFALLKFGPRDHVDISKIKTENLSIEDVYSIINADKSAKNLKLGQEKQVIWNGEIGKKTPISIVYIHGFSASLGEIRPVPDMVAKAINANIFYTRLEGHGQSGEELSQARVNDWLNDTNEAFEIGRAIGDQVVVISASTGSTLTTALLIDPEKSKDIQSVIFVSPNFKVKNWQADLARLAFFDIWGPWIGGRERSWETHNEMQAKYWTTRYPLPSVVPLLALIDYVEDVDFAKINTPALFYYAPNDEVVEAKATDEVITKWGGKTETIHPQLTENDDISHHLIAGDAHSPDQNEIAAKAMIEFIEANY